MRWPSRCRARISRLVNDTARSAFDKEYHPGQHELIGVGHQYLGEGKVGNLVGNVVANIESVRRRAEAQHAEPVAPPDAGRITGFSRFNVRGAAGAGELVRSAAC